MPKEVRLMVPVQVPEEALGVWSDKLGLTGEDGPMKAVSRVATQLLRDYAAGGVMLTPDSTARVAKALGDEGLDSERIARAVESAVGLDGDDMIARFRINADVVRALGQIAEMQGITPQQVVQQGFEYCIDRGWLWELPLLGRTVRFSREEWEEFCGLTGIEPEGEIPADSVIKLAAFVKMAVEQRQQEARLRGDLPPAQGGTE